MRHLGSVASDLRMLWLARRGYQMLMVRDKALGALIGLLAARLAGIPFVYWMSFPMVEAWAVFARERGLSVGPLRWLAAKLRATVLRWLLYKLVLPRADHVFVQSDVMLEHLRAAGLREACLTAVPMGVDTELMPGAGVASQDEQMAAATVAPTFVYLGTLNQLRRPGLMVEAFALVLQEFPNARLLLIGDAEERADRESLREHIAAHGVQAQVEVTGWLPSEEGWRRTLGAVAGLSPVPRSELLEFGSPTKAVEYFHLGLPVIANDQPDQAMLVRAAGGMCAPLTKEGFAAAMLDVLRRPAHHLAVAEVGQRLVRERRSYAALANLVAGVLQTLLANRHRVQ